ncbi:membrane protein insertase YidC [Woeseia oceani]|uniref:Membrane protein insertase YidC n=1 Tax=Woeseia oceani TaxID=1548547 RepID=A0A193LBH1_9GAMM|nr:membrane protein insertase YidC [Woeseia oceani]ANO49813.1 membrane protein insertase YidC [Woeseia oceani]
MENQRLLIWATFGLMLWLSYEAWMQDYGPQPQAPISSETINAPTETPLTDDLPPLPAGSGDAATDGPSLMEPQAVAPSPATTAASVHVTTDVLDLTISLRGATITEAHLKKYPIAKDQPNKVIALLSTENGDTGALQTGLRAADGAPEANHLSTFSSSRDNYELSGDVLEVPFTWTDESGLVVEKRFRFARGSYRIDVVQTVRNGTATVWRGASYAQLQRRSKPVDRSMFDVDSYSFDGPIIYDGEKSTKLQRDDLLSDGAYSVTASDGWVAAIEHHFLSAIIPPKADTQRYNIAIINDVVVASTIGPAQRIAPGAEMEYPTTLFVGPKLQRQLDQISPKLKLTVDYGWLTLISGPLFWLLSKVHTLVQNWGLAIILVTVLIKLAFYKLTEASGRSMAKMRKIQPRMKALQERYKDDRQGLSQAMMDLYKREKVNPAAGCLPILIQMPFFLAFYWVLLESVEMRQAPFALWITDLSSRDPYFILPIIMGVAMLFQQRLNPAPADPIQARVMQIMPVVFTGFFAFFPAGLVLYWVTNTLLSIAQQWRINKVVEQEDKKRSTGKKVKKNKDSD